MHTPTKRVTRALVCWPGGCRAGGTLPSSPCLTHGSRPDPAWQACSRGEGYPPPGREGGFFPLGVGITSSHARVRRLQPGGGAQGARAACGGGASAGAGDAKRVRGGAQGRHRPAQVWLCQVAHALPLKPLVTSPILLLINNQHCWQQPPPPPRPPHAATWHTPSD